ncbi:MAG TPA: SDR family oxidoreductase [Pyrinomonadaceae bacterium]|nr:SDR family oxidoreductase [Pyrinomonadaceae bacterium]
MKVLIFGAAGMLGHKLYQRLSSRFEVAATIRGEFSSIERYGIFDRSKIVENIDVRDKAAVETAIVSVNPDVVVNAVGVIKQLPSAKDVITTLEINAIFPHRLAEFGAEFGFRTISISTDCVFDGAIGNYRETDVPNATDLYGKSKALGELNDDNCLTLRTSIIGRELGTSHSLIDWFLSNHGGSVKGFTKAIYSGFPTVVFADIIGDLVANRPELSGLYQVASEPINKFELLKLVNEAYDANIEIVPEDDFTIDRSLNAAKFNELTGFRPAAWPELIAQMAADETDYDSFK